MSFPDGSIKIEPLAPTHDRSSFRCGNDPLDLYIRQQAGQDMRRGTALVHVAVEMDKPDRILGFYTLSATCVAATDLPAEMAKQMPRYPVPAALIGRLAVDLSTARQGLGRILVADAVRKAMEAARTIAICVIVVDPIDDGARDFYMRFGFRSLLGPERRLFLVLRP